VSGGGVGRRCQAEVWGRGVRPDRRPQARRSATVVHSFEVALAPATVPDGQ